MVQSFFYAEEGQGLVEYGLLLMLIMLVVIAILTVMGGKVSTMYSSINSTFAYYEFTKLSGARF